MEQIKHCASSEIQFKPSFATNLPQMCQILWADNNILHLVYIILGTEQDNACSSYDFFLVAYVSPTTSVMYWGADKSLARPGRKQATSTFASHSQNN